MKPKLAYRLLPAVVALVLTAPVNAQTLSRLSANFNGAPEKVTTALPAAGGAGGLQTFTKTVFVPLGHNVLFVTISATGDQHGGDKLLMNCKVDGVNCGVLTNPAIGSGGAPSGWIVLGHTATGASGCNDGGGGTADCHDNVLNYTWCKGGVTSGASHVIRLKLASLGGSQVFYEGASYYIDSAHMTTNACTSVS